MYDLNNLLPSLVQLGQWLREEAPQNDAVKRSAEAANGWFTAESIDLALRSHGEALSEEGVTAWLHGRTRRQEGTKQVGMVLAGNLPLVGWNDIMCGVVAGHEVHAKLSKDDQVLPRWVWDQWTQLEPSLAGRVTFHDGLMKGMDAMVATGGANTSRYFQAYFGHLPHVIRGQRTSVALLDGEESDEELRALGHDIFAHFGMGCRSVTKLCVPQGFDLDRCFGQWLEWVHLAQHSKYANNYDYHKAVWLLNRESLVENGFLLVKEDEGLFSPIGTLFVERHDSCAMAIERLAQRESEIQVAVVREGSPWSAVAAEAGLRCVSLGAGQRPSLMDFADGVDTLDFLLGL